MTGRQRFGLCGLITNKLCWKGHLEAVWEWECAWEHPVGYQGCPLLCAGGWDVGTQAGGGFATSFPGTVTSGCSMLLKRGGSWTCLFPSIWDSHQSPTLPSQVQRALRLLSPHHSVLDVSHEGHLYWADTESSL